MEGLTSPDRWERSTVGVDSRMNVVSATRTFGPVSSRVIETESVHPAGSCIHVEYTH